MIGITFCGLFGTYTFSQILPLSMPIVSATSVALRTCFHFTCISHLSANSYSFVVKVWNITSIDKSSYAYFQAAYVHTPGLFAMLFLCTESSFMVRMLTLYMAGTSGLAKLMT